MAIHHDKSAYGKLAPLSQRLTDDKLAEIARKLSRGENSEKCVKEVENSQKEDAEDI